MRSYGGLVDFPEGIHNRYPRASMVRFWISQPRKFTGARSNPATVGKTTAYWYLAGGARPPGPGHADGVEMSGLDRGGFVGPGFSFGNASRRPDGPRDRTAWRGFKNGIPPVSRILLKKRHFPNAIRGREPGWQAWKRNGR